MLDGEGRSVCPSWTLSVSGSGHDLPLSPPGASQATNRENIQKAISRLDEDLTTLGQMSKLSESLGFPHQVRVLCPRLPRAGSGVGKYGLTAPEGGQRARPVCGVNPDFPLVKEGRQSPIFCVRGEAGPHPHPQGRSML